MYEPTTVETWSQRKDRDKETFAAELRAERNRLIDEARLESSRAAAPLAWELVGLLWSVYSTHDFPALEGILGEHVDQFTETLALVQRRARNGREMKPEQVEILARWCWPFVMHEEEMVLLTQRIDASVDAEARIVASSNAA